MLSYFETIPDDLAKVILGKAFVPGAEYKMFSDKDGSCICAYDKETGARLDLAGEDDFKLDVEEFEFAKEELEELDNDYTASAFKSWPLVIGLCCLIFTVSIGALVLCLLWR